MILSDEEIGMVQKNESQFVSFKYLDDKGVLKQIDTSFQNILDGKRFFSDDSINLKTIIGKAFIDPFRSFPTTSFFCENLTSKDNQRGKAIKLIDEYSEPDFVFLGAEIRFWVFKKINDCDKFTSGFVDPFANLRSDIIACMEKINIPTTTHNCGEIPTESVVGIEGNSIVDLADNVLLAKFIIANVTDSYGMSALFSCDPSASNLALLARGNTERMTENARNITRDSAKIKEVTGLKTDNLKDSSVLTIHKAELNDDLVNIKISMQTKGEFVPYLAFTELLLYNAVGSSLGNTVF
ncbi:MAG: hypothetical protein COA94_07650 [Rickettsiales bacterium]|nr:MAG: hypothetical protein COA94_07650 [Rickettsiales bacterium]